MYKTRARYWSSSPVARWIRNRVAMEKPTSETLEGWDDWKTVSKKDHPFVYWLTEKFLNKLQDVVYYPRDVLSTIRVYLVNRFVDKTHCLPTGLQPGQYHEVDERLLHGLFQTFVDFIEIEKAWMHVAWADDEVKAKFSVPWYRRFWWFKVKRWRCPKAGLAHLQWEMDLRWSEHEVGDDTSLIGQPTYQAVKAKEQFELYDWWKNIRPNRPDPYDASGWSAICDEGRIAGRGVGGFARTVEEKERSNKALDLLRDIEQQYDQEDEDMIIRLIKLRRSLWT